MPTTTFLRNSYLRNPLQCLQASLVYLMDHKPMLMAEVLPWGYGAVREGLLKPQFS